MGDHSYKSKETRVVTYTCRYSSGHLIDPYNPVMSGWIRDWMPARISAGVGDHHCFLTFYNCDHYWQ